MSEAPSLFIATPAYRGDVRGIYALSLVWTSHELAKAGIRHKNEIYGGTSQISIARGILAAEFMASGMSHLMFIDGDIAWKPGDVLRLIAADHDICCGVYPKRGHPLQFPCNFEYLEDETGRYTVEDERTGYWALKDAPGGFMLIKREALVRMILAYPQRWCKFRADGAAPASEACYEYDLFEVGIDPTSRRYMTEDFGFCRLWRDIGGRIWADPEIELNHDGFKGSIKSLLEGSDGN